MLKFCNIAFIFCCMNVYAMGEEISLSGTVYDGKGSAVSGATVTLVSDVSKKNITGVNGEFNIGGSTAVNNEQSYGYTVKNVDNIDISGRQLKLSLISHVNNIVISVFSGNGKRNHVIESGVTNAGLHTFALPELAQGLYILNITIDKAVITRKLVSTGREILMSGNISGVNSALRNINSAAAAEADTIIVTKNGYVTVKKTVSSYRQTGIEIMMDLAKSTVIAVKDLPVIKEMPSPLTMNNGTKVTTIDQWKDRRREMIQIFEDYEYGHMPPPPGNVKATVATAVSRVTVSGQSADYRMMHLTFGPGDKCGFDLGIFTPVTEPETNGYPLLISLDYSAGKTSLGASSAALKRGYAVATIPYNQLGADAASWKTSGFFPSYPDYDWRDFSAWAWGISRAIDYLVTDSLIDREKIMVTGTSRLGQAALLAGAFDERIALTAPVAGGMAFRFSGKEMGGGKGQGITEIVDQNTYWFGPLLPDFKNKTTRLPCDQHWLPALTAPRLFIMCNSFADEYGRAYAAVQTYLGALPVYEFLNVDEDIGLNFRAGGHGMTAEDWSALLDFADQKLLKKAWTRKFNVIPPADKTP